MLKEKVDSILNSMHRAKSYGDSKAGGDYGEDAVLALVDEYAKVNGGRVYHSFGYDLFGEGIPANIKREGGWRLFFSNPRNSFNVDEIDVLYVNDRAVFVIEVKSYRKTLLLEDYWSKENGGASHKCPLAQTEKHARHLRYYIYSYIPDDTYIIPITVFVDRSSITDRRSQEFRDYINVCILDTFLDTLIGLDKYKEYRLDVKKIHTKLLTFGTYNKR